MRCTSRRWIEVGALCALALGATLNLNAARAEETWSLRVEPTLLVDLDARIYASEAEGLTGFALGRLRPGLSVKPADWVSATATVEFAGEYATVYDAYVALTPDPSLEVKVGLSKTPLFWSHREPVETLAFPTATAVAQSLRVQRDTGRDLAVSALWAPEALPIEVLARVGNGSASFLANDNMELAYYLGLDLVLGRARRGGTGEAGLRLGVTGVYEHAEDRNGITAAHALGFIYRRSPTVSGDRFVGAAHLLALYGPFTLLVEGGYADEARNRDHDGNPATPRIDLESYVSYGVSAELGWSFCGRREPSRVRAPGVIDLGLRLERLWVGQDASDVVPGGGMSATLTAKWWPTTFMAVSALGTVIGYDVPAIEDPSRETSWGALVRLSFFAR